MTKTKRLLSLFSGCGGMDLGFHGDFTVFKSLLCPIESKDWTKEFSHDMVTLKKTSFETVFANDILPHANIAWLSHFSQHIENASEVFHSKNIVDIVKNTNESGNVFPKNIDIITGGFPCQDFSVAGKRQGMQSKRGTDNKKTTENLVENRGKLYLWLKEVVKVTNPKIFIAENVKGLLSVEGALETILKDFSNINKGFVIAPIQVLNAKDYGVPQNRERVIFICINKEFVKNKLTIDRIADGSISLYPTKTHGTIRSYTTVNDVVNNLKEPDDETNDLSQQSYSKAKLIKGYQGNIAVDINGTAPTIRAEHHGNIEFRRLSKENGGKNNDNKTLPQRRLTVRECARIQTFPDSFDFVTKKTKENKNNISASGGYKVIGNAVPPLLAYHIAKKIEDVWDDIFI